MGQDLNAIFRNAFDSTEIAELPERLDRELTALKTSLEDARLHDIKNSPERWLWRWDPSFDPPFDEWLAIGKVNLCGPGSLFLDIGTKAVTLASWVRWREFITDVKVQQAMRKIVFQFAKCFNSEVAIYVSDSSSRLGEMAGSMAIEESSIEEILEFLGQTTEPAVSFNKICKEATAQAKTPGITDCDGYYLDRFDDFEYNNDRRPQKTC